MKTIKIKDYYGIYQEVPVSDELYEEFRGSTAKRIVRTRRKTITAALFPMRI